MLRLLLPEDLRVLRNINTVARDLFEVARGTTRQELDLLREPTPADFVRWTKYAPRVRRVDASAIRGSFNLSEARPLKQKQQRQNLTEAPLLAHGLIDKLQAHCPTPLLPNIQTLSYCEESFTMGNGALVALPASAHFQPTLQAVSLGLALHVDPDWHLQDLTSRLSLVAPRLEQLSFWINMPSFSIEPYPRSQRSHSTTLRGMGISRLSCLTSFTAPHMSVALQALLCLGWLPHLRKLDIQPPMAPEHWLFNPRGRRPGFFTALEELRLTGKEGNYQDCIDLLGAITPTSLRTVSLDLRWPDNGTAEALFTDLCAALGSLPCRDTVKNIKMTVESNRHGDNIYRSPSLAPLLELHALESLVVQGGPKVIVTDAILDSMSRAWPHARIIRFAWPTPPKTYPLLARDRPRATLAGLVSLVLRCPHLEELEVALNMRAVPGFGGCPPVPLKNAGMCKLSVFAGDCTPHETWRRTEEIYGQLTALRRQERDWALDRGKTIQDLACP
ncbi:hypothetical protein VTO73DRAFT_10645 [Trametes versicolor]